jgi:hypothetical protein
MATMIELRTWRRHHVSGDISEVTSIPGIGSWEACIQVAGGTHNQQVGRHFTLLMDAQEAADSLARTLTPHDCSACEVWRPVERRRAVERRRPTERQQNKRRGRRR